MGDEHLDLFSLVAKIRPANVRCLRDGSTRVWLIHADHDILFKIFIGFMSYALMPTLDVDISRNLNLEIFTQTGFAHK